MSTFGKHSTNDELLFLDKIGKHVESEKDEFKDSKRLLKKYIQASSFRKDWNGMSKEVIIKHAIFLLNGRYWNGWWRVLLTTAKWRTTSMGVRKWVYLKSC